MLQSDGVMPGLADPYDYGFPVNDLRNRRGPRFNGKIEAEAGAALPRDRVRAGTFILSDGPRIFNRVILLNLRVLLRLSSLRPFLYSANS